MIMIIRCWAVPLSPDVGPSPQRPAQWGLIGGDFLKIIVIIIIIMIMIMIIIIIIIITMIINRLSGTSTFN